MIKKANENHPVFSPLLRLLFSSDDFIQAQQQLARWASEDVVSVVVLEPGSDSTTTGVGHSQTADTHHHGDSLMIGTGLNVGPRDYYPSPPSTETESSGSVIQPLRRVTHIDPVHGDVQLTETSGMVTKHFRTNIQMGDCQSLRKVNIFVFSRFKKFRFDF